MSGYSQSQHRPLPAASRDHEVLPTCVYGLHRNHVDILARLHLHHHLPMLSRAGHLGYHHSEPKMHVHPSALGAGIQLYYLYYHLRLLPRFTTREC